MWQRTRRFLTAPTSEVLSGSEEEIQRAGLLHSLVSIHAAFLVALVFVSFFTPAPLIALSAVASLLLVDILALFLNRRGRVSLAARLFTTALWLVITVLTVVLGGVYGVAVSAYLVIVAVAAFLLSLRETAVFVALTVLAILALAWAQDNNYLPAPLGESSPIFMWLALSVYTLMLGGIARLATRSLYTALVRAQQSEQSLASSYRQLEESRDALDAQTHFLEQRTIQLRAAAEVSRAVVSLLDMEELLWQAAELLADRFDLYHVGIFQLDGTGRWAEYRAGAGEAGRLLVEQQFRLAVGGDSIIGWCTAHAQSRLIQDTRAGDGDARTARIDHPLVPRTLSEAALPLLARGRVLGALSLQSDRPGTFDPDTVNILQTIADQIAFAIDNVRLLVSSQQALESARRAYAESTHQGWADLLSGRGGWGYRYEGADVSPLDDDDGQGKAPEHTAETEVGIPLKIRDKMVGVLSFCKDAGQPEGQGDGVDGRDPSTVWTADETRLLERLVEQMGLALESARLYQDTQRSAARDRLLAEVVGRVRETLDVESVLRTLAYEVRQALDLPEVVVRLRGDTRAAMDAEVADDD